MYKFKNVRKDMTVKSQTVFVQGRFMNQATRDLMSHYGFSPVDNINAADCVVWTGGEDIGAAIYNEKEVSCYSNARRDKEDIKAIDQSKDKFKIGICRGAQLLNCIPNGGKLWQDVDGHGGGYHEIYDNINHETYIVNSLHHQMLRINQTTAELVAWTRKATYKKAWQSEWHIPEIAPAGVVEGDDVDPEVVWYPSTKSLLVQYHPEFGHQGTRNYFYTLLDRYYEAA